MYFPFLRGKQFELIALKEICDVMSLNRAKVSPIIEPVKQSSTLNTTLNELKKNDINFSLVINPRVGDLKDKVDVLSDYVGSSLSNYSNFEIAVNISERTNHAIIQKALAKLVGNPFKLTLIHNIESLKVNELLDSYSRIFPIENNVINFKETGSRYYREFDSNTRVRLDDGFSIQEKNKDYLTILDSKFSEEHLYYRDDGYKGFSDYLTIGDNYNESGFLPFAIAIHLTYLADGNKIRVKHFVSDSNDDTSDTAGKFSEALEKLINWSKTLSHKTKAIRMFEDLYATQHFPGLGTLKKLSIMHHIELVLRVI